MRVGVIAGHSHQPGVEWVEDAGHRWLHLNPGSAGPRRFSLPVTVAHLELDPAGARPPAATIVPLL